MLYYNQRELKENIREALPEFPAVSLSYVRKGKNMSTRPARPDRSGSHRAAYNKNRKTILATQDTCAICGMPVDKSLPSHDPMSACVDHIIPVAKGGHPSALENLQLAHWTCNRQKSDKLYSEKREPKVVGNRNLPQSRDWASYEAPKD
jgi:5-methylcytosine-specific restriction endonuclease McrA